MYSQTNYKQKLKDAILALDAKIYHILSNEKIIDNSNPDTYERIIRYTKAREGLSKIYKEWNDYDVPSIPVDTDFDKYINKN